MSSFLTLAVAFYTFRVIYPLSYMKVRSQAKGFLGPFWIDRYRYLPQLHNFSYYFFTHCFSSYSEFEANWDVIFTFSCAA